jgi:hypothetical protein
MAAVGFTSFLYRWRGTVYCMLDGIDEGPQKKLLFSQSGEQKPIIFALPCFCLVIYISYLAQNLLGFHLVVLVVTVVSSGACSR